MYVTLVWLEDRADRYKGQKERWNMSSQGELARSWVASGWAKIIEEATDTLPTSEVVAVEDPVFHREVKRPRRSKRKVKE